LLPTRPSLRSGPRGRTPAVIPTSNSDGPRRRIGQSSRVPGGQRCRESPRAHVLGRCNALPYSRSSAPERPSEASASAPPASLPCWLRPRQRPFASRDAEPAWTVPRPFRLFAECLGLRSCFVGCAPTQRTLPFGAAIRAGKMSPFTYRGTSTHPVRSDA